MTKEDPLKLCPKCQAKQDLYRPEDNVMVICECWIEGEKKASPWISTKDRLPYQEPEHWLTYDYVLVTSIREPKVLSIGRYTENGWELLYSEGPCCGDVTAFIDIEDITHWMPIPAPPKDDG